MGTHRVAIVGTGFGVRTQLPGFRAAGGYEIVSLTGADPAKTQRIAEAHDIPHAIGSIEDAVRVGEPDLVCVTTPPVHHRAMALEVLRAGRHCLLEKPMAMDAREAAELVDAAGTSGRIALIDHELRALPNRREIRRRVRAGDIGRPLAARVRHTSPGRADPSTRHDWFSSRAAGGGMLGAVGSHIVDMLSWWLGPVRSVRARLTTAIPARTDREGVAREVETDDAADLLLGFEPPLETTISITALAERHGGIEWELFGTEGALRIVPDGRLLASRRGNAEVEDISVDDDLGDPPGLDGTLWSRAFVLLARDLDPALRRGEAPPYAARFTDGLATQRVLDAARRSHAEGGRDVSP